MRARIFKPGKTAMQSGRGAGQEWMLEYEVKTARRPEPLMGWVSSGDTLNQVRIPFPSKAAAIAFAEDKGLEFFLDEPHQRKVRPKSYLDNFKYRPAEEA